MLLRRATASIEAARAGPAGVDMSTIAPARHARGSARRWRERGVAHARRARHRLLAARRGRHADDHGAAAPSGDFERARPLLEAMGRLIVHVGELGQGQMLKLINNALGAANAARVAEALLLAERDRHRPRRVRAGRRRRLRRLGAARAEGRADARARLHDALQDRAHAQGRAPVPGGGAERRHAVPGRRPRARPAHGDDRHAATARTTTPP